MGSDLSAPFEEAGMSHRAGFPRGCLPVKWADLAPPSSGRRVSTYRASQSLLQSFAQVLANVTEIFLTVSAPHPQQVP